MARLKSNVAEVTDANIERWWNRIKETGGTFALFDTYSREWFESVMRRSSMVLEWAFGVGRVGNVRYGDDIEVHGFFWSRPEPETLKWAIGRVAEFYRVRTVTVEVPLAQAGLRRFVYRLGAEPDRVTYKVAGKSTVPMVGYQWRIEENG